MLPELKARAFTISGVEDMTVVQAIRDRIADLPAGVPWDQAKKDLVKNLHPWLDDEESGTKRSEARAELLLRTHGFQAYSAAAERVMDRQRDVFPYCQYKSMEDARVRPTHAALDGVVLPADHEFWLTHTPPWDWGCRCLKIPLSEDDLGDIQASDAGKNPDNRDILDEPAARELSSTRRLVRNGVSYNMTAPAESGKPGSFTWTPGSLRIPIDQLREQYIAKGQSGAETFHGFETMAKGHDLGGGVTLWDWLNGEPLKAQSFPPVAPAGAKQPMLPFHPPAAPPAPAIPAAPVSAALQVTARQPLAGVIRHALDQIDKVHDDGALPATPINGKVKSGSNGTYFSRGGVPDHIGVASSGPWPHLTACHEIGHFLDHQAISARGRWASMTDSAFADWKNAVHASSAYQTLLGHPLRPKVRSYLLDPKELFARSYAQWIAEKSGDAKLLAELDQARTRQIPGVQWSKNDFALISQALDSLFRHKGWL